MADREAAVREQAVADVKMLLAQLAACREENQRLREALEQIWRMADSASYGEIPAMPIAERARAALDTTRGQE